MHYRSLFFLAALTLACTDTTEENTQSGPVERVETDEWGLITCSEQTENETCFTHRSLVGVSMGSSGAGQIGLSRPDLFDSIGMLGVPMVDWVYMMRMFEKYYLGGFCDRETILANIDDLNNPDGDAFCGPVAGEVKIVPTGEILEAPQDHNHWFRGVDEGRGGSFGRDKLRKAFQDISLAYGNGLYYNPESPYFPPGVPMDYREKDDPERCENPVVIKGLKEKYFNPDGEYDVIPVCDSKKWSGQEGNFNPDKANEFSFEMLLAVDYNGNGQRDYAEPVIVMAHEPYDDVGNGPNDKYDWDMNPAGKAGNWRYDEGEPFEDYGLDGVPGTGDYGEGNGKFDYSPNVLNYFAQNPRNLIEEMPQGHLDRLHIWADAGIRDFLHSAGGTNWLWGALENRTSGETSRDYTSFKSLMKDGQPFDFVGVDYSEESIGRHAYVRYGDPAASERDINRGDGNHVGPADQVINRFLTALSFVQSRFYERDVQQVDEVGEVNQLIKPKTYYSKSLDEERPYGIVFPPGYFSEENQNKRYPVVYFLHGQGQESDHLLASGILFFGYMAGSTNEERQRRFQSDWAKFILVFPDSRCRRGECQDGNFNSNHRGLDGSGPRFEDALFELMAEVEQKYRVARPVVVPR